MVIDYTTPLGQVRLLTADTSEPPLIDDAMIDGYLALNNGNVKRSAADALDAVATSETLVSKKITTQDLSTDGPAMAKELRAQAQRLRDQADDADADDGAFFDLIEFNPYGRHEAEEARL